MPGNPSIDRFETLECVERHGVVRSLTRLARVIGLTDTSYRVLWSGLSKAGIPAAYSELRGIDAEDGQAIPAAFNALVLVDRSAKIVEQDKTVDVTLKYEHLLDGPNQNLFAPPRGILFTKGRSSVVQKATNFFYPNGKTTLQVRTITGVDAGANGLVRIQCQNHGLHDGDSVTIAGVTGTVEANGTFIVTVIDANKFNINVIFVNNYTGGGTITGTNVQGGAGAQSVPAPRTQILVSHTFPFTDAEYPGHCRIQGGDVNVPFPQDNVKLEGYLRTPNPFALKARIHRKINVNTWMNQPPLTWICSEVQWEVLDPTPPGPGGPLYRFEFEFQNDPDTWDPDVTFIDSRTGVPPSGIEQASMADQFGTLRLRPNEGNVTVPDPVLPAGVWKVPILQRINFNEFFASLFEGFQGL